MQPQRLPRAIPQSVTRSAWKPCGEGSDPRRQREEMHVCPQADFRSGNRYPLPLGSDPTGSWECNEKRVAEEYATTSMSIVMPTMARSMTQFGLLMILVVLPMQMLLWWCHARESMPTNRIHRSTFRGNRKAVRSKSTLGADFTAPTAFSLARRI